jgi:hypothetical protein
MEGRLKPSKRVNLQSRSGNRTFVFCRRKPGSVRFQAYVASDPAKDTQLIAALDLLRGKTITKTEPESDPPKLEKN